MKSAVSVIARNIFSLMGTSILNQIIIFFVTICLIRYLGVIALGQYTFIMTFVGLFGFVGDIGLSQLAIREVSKNEKLAPKYLGNLLQIQWIVSAIIFLLVIISSRVLNYSGIILKGIFIYSVGVTIYCLGNPVRAILNAFEMMHINSAISLGLTILNSILLLLIVFFSGSIMHLLATSIITNTISLILATFACFKKCTIPEFKTDFMLWISLMKMAAPFAFLMGFNIIYERIDIIMLSKMIGAEAVGFYAAAYKLINLFMFFPAIISQALFPFFSRQFANSVESLSGAIRKSTKYIVAFGLPVSVGGAILAKKIITFLFGQQYYLSIPAMRILIWIIVIRCLYSLLNSAILAANKTVVLTLLNAFCVILNIGINLILIPKYSFIGAAWATLIVEFFLLILTHLYVRRVLDFNIPFLNYLKIFFAGIGMASITSLFINSNLFIVIIASILTYLILLWVLKFFSSSDIRLLRQMFFKGNERIIGIEGGCE